jgi:hypothetical protein
MAEKVLRTRPLGKLLQALSPIWGHGLRVHRWKGVITLRAIQKKTAAGQMLWSRIGIVVFLGTPAAALKESLGQRTTGNGTLAPKKMGALLTFT